MSFLAKWGENGRWHLANTIFEGFIGACHLLAPDKIYNGGDRGQEKLLSRFTGALMLAFAFVSFRARRDQRSAGGRAVLEAMALYHGIPPVEMMHNMFGNAKDSARGRQMPVHFSWTEDRPFGHRADFKDSDSARALGNGIATTNPNGTLPEKVP